MTMMQPDPASDFREEKEFRAKVYRMLSLGLDTTEIEGLLRRRIDWSLFSENTLRNMVENENKVCIQVPDMSYTVVQPIKAKLKTLEKVAAQKLVSLKKQSHSLENLVCGMVTLTVVNSLLLVAILIAMCVK